MASITQAKINSTAKKNKGQYVVRFRIYFDKDNIQYKTSSDVMWRKLGTPNKRQKIGKRIDAFIDNEWDNLPFYMEGMSDKEKAEFILKLLPYATPKYSSRVYQTDVTENYWGL